MMTFSRERSLGELFTMLSYRRPGGSRSERRFIHSHLSPLKMEVDGAGNFYKRIGDTPVLWSCHTDTVHRDGGRQKIVVADNHAFISKEDKVSNCLGADDTAGVFLMCEMIRAERPGLYIFHRQEESGGVGSNYMVKHGKEIFKDIQWAIALDRKGTDDVITHQFSRCCSDEFGDGLANKLGGGYKPSSNGVFTDTANYVDDIGECTNLSVGYYNQHSTGECLDISFIMELREKLLDLNFDNLPSVRKPGETDYADWGEYAEYYGSRYSGAAYGSFGGLDYFNSNVPVRSSSTNRYHSSAVFGGYDYRKFTDSAGAMSSQKTFSEIIEEYPEEIADVLIEYGFDLTQLVKELEARGCDPAEVLHAL